MKKHFFWIKYLIIFTFLLTSCGDNGTAEPTGNIDDLIISLENDGFVVQEGKYILVDAIDLLNRGIIASANGNNAGNPYFTYSLPLAPGQSFSNEIADPDHPGYFINYHLRSDEALLLVGRTPPEEKYFSYRSFLLTRYSSELGRQDVIYGALGDTINNLTVNDGTTNPFNQPLVIITAADKGIVERVKNAVIASGYPENIVNLDALPGEMLNMGLGSQSDTFTFLSRNALPANKDRFDSYKTNPGMRVFRLTPEIPSPTVDLYPRPTLKPRGTGETEAWLQSGMDDLRNAILNHYGSSYDATEFPTSQWLPETLIGIDEHINVIGESRDTPYLWTGTDLTPAPPATFILPDDPDDFLIVYGVNHQASGKATYSNFTVYGAKYLNGVASVASPSLEGSADDYIPGHALNKYLYAWKVARRCDGSTHCLVVPFGPKHYGFGSYADDLYGFVGFRAYLEPATTVGADWNELIFDRVIKFTKKK